MSLHSLSPTFTALTLTPRLPLPPVPASPSGLQNFSPSELSLLDGFRRFLQFLIDAETEVICGAPPYIQTSRRANYRLGGYWRKLTTPMGTFPIRVPHLRYFHARTPMVKRARRLAPEILETLSRLASLPPERDTACERGTGFQPVGSSGTAFQPVDGAAAPTVNRELGTVNSGSFAPTVNREPGTVNLFSPSELPLVSHLIRLVWTLDLPDPLLAKLTTQLHPILTQWRTDTLHL